MPLPFTTSRAERGAALAALAAALLAAGCQPVFRDQPYYRAQEPSRLFADSASVRPEVPGTVAQNLPDHDAVFYTGMEGGKPAERFPEPVTAALVARGRDRFNVFCAPCHDERGTGRGMVVRRGFPPPPSYHTARLRNAPPGHFFDVITHGFGMMYSYGDRVPPADRWAIIAYIRALQLSDHVPLAALRPGERDSLGEARR